MKLKKLLSGFLAAAMAVTTMVTATFTASAADATKQFMVGNDKVPTSELVDVAKAVITAKIISKGSATYMQAFAQSQTSSWAQANVDIGSTEEQTFTVDFTPAVTDSYHQVGIQAGADEGTDLSDVDVKILKVEYQKADGTVVTAYDPFAPAISKDNFTYSTYKNTSMKIGDKFTVTFDSVVNGVGIPAGATYDFKYKVPEADGGFAYYAPVFDGEVNGTEGQDATGLKVTSEESGTKKIFTFEAVSASKDEFVLNIETKVNGTVGYLWFTYDMGYKVLVSDHTITIDPAIENGTVKSDKTTAAKDEKVTLTVTPATGYELDTLTVATSTAGTDTVTVAADNTFTMPDADVTVTAAFKAAALKEITLDKTTAAVLVGKTVALTATKDPVTDKTEITWTSDTPAVATVSATGVVTGVKAGTAVITATCGEKTATCTVTVTAEEIACTGVTLDKATATVMKGATVTLTATATPADTTDEITWESSDTSIATVKDGVVTAVARGVATITVKCGEKSATCKVSVNEEETLSAPKSFKSAVTDGKYNKNDVLVISAADVAAAKSVTITVTDNNGRKTTKDVTECYKMVTYKAADGTTDTISAGANFLIAVTVTGIPDGTTVTVTATVNK